MPFRTEMVRIGGLLAAPLSRKYLHMLRTLAAASA